MPASLFDDLDHHGGGGGGGLPMSLHGSSSGNTSCSVSNVSGVGGGGGSLIDEDQRALQLALELSMLGLTDSSAALQLAASVAADHQHHLQQQQQQHLHSNNLLNQHHHHHLNHQNNSSSVLSSDIYSTGGNNCNNGGVGELLPKKSQNMTECVPVPSSEHVAEIVGRQGCKIKALRAKTNTYIKTPVRGEEPVFVVTGRKEDVASAKREILSAADHFSQIRASRKGGSGGNGPSAPAPVPGQVTIQVRVPYRVVGLVVGPKGATIKRIQQQTHTYIVTPSRDKDPVFEVTGLPDNVQVAKREIEAHIAIRTGSYPTENLGNHPMLGDNDLTNPADILASLYKSGIGALGLESLGLGGLGSLGSAGLGATINSLSSSLSSVNGLGGALAHNNANNMNSAPGNSVGSSTSGGGSLSSLSSLNGFKVGGDGGFYGGHPALADLGFSLMDNTSSSNNGTSNNTTNNNGTGQNTSPNGGFMSSSRSEDSYLFGGSGGSASGSTSGPDSLGHEEGSQGKLNELFQATNSVSSSLWASFDRDEGLGDSPTLEQTAGVCI